MEVNKIINGCCLEQLKDLEDNSVDAIITDPPYGLGFMGKHWDTFDESQFGIKGNEGENDLKVKKNFNILPRYCSDGLYDFTKEWAKECFRVLKHGGHLLSFSGTRTYHKICMGIEDAGFEIRDMISWLYGSGFPKSYNIGKGIQKLKTEGNASWNGTGDSSNGALGYSKLQHEQGYRPEDYSNKHQSKSELTEEEAKEWEGWGTALKPACEPIVVARKPLSEKNVALNILKWGTGGINIDGCRVEGQWNVKTRTNNPDTKQVYGNYAKITTEQHPLGRFPANLIHDGSEEVRECFPNKSQRFFYCAKASKSERNAGLGYNAINNSDKYNGKFPCSKADKNETNKHPTVKPIKLMEYLVRLVTPPKGVVLDPFMGSGTTGIAAVKQGFNFIGIEKEADYLKIAEARIKHYSAQQKQEAGE